MQAQHISILPFKPSIILTLPPQIRFSRFKFLSAHDRRCYIHTHTEICKIPVYVQHYNPIRNIDSKLYLIQHCLKCEKKTCNKTGQTTSPTTILTSYPLPTFKCERMQSIEGEEKEPTC